MPDMNPYLRTKIMTANPMELRLMLFEGAIKFCRQSAEALGRKDFEKMYNALVRAQKIVLELSTSLNHEMDPELCGKLAGLYNYIYRRLVDANMERDVSCINECIDLLDYERQTWILVMNEMRAQEVSEPVMDSSEPADNPYAPLGQIQPDATTTVDPARQTAISSFFAEG